MVMVVGADNDDNGNGGSNSSSDTDQEIYIERRDKKTQIRCKIHSTKVKHIIYMLRRLQYVVHVIAMSNAMCMNDIERTSKFPYSRKEKLKRNLISAYGGLA